MTEWNGIKVGDIITTRLSGYWKLESIQERKKGKIFFHCDWVCSNTGFAFARESIWSDASLCKKVSLGKLLEDKERDLISVASSHDRLIAAISAKIPEAQS